MEKIIVVGGGTMGAGIAFVAARGGYAVDLIEPDIAAQQRARARIARDADRAKVDLSARLNVYSQIAGGTAALLAIEAVPEQLQLKTSVFQTLAARLGPNTVLATNTSSLSVSEIAEAVERPERVIGLHFFNPPSAMKLVEIVRANQTDDATLEVARDVAVRLGKTPVITEDTPGFIVNRIARPFYLQSMRAYEAGVAPLEELDRLARGAGFPMGPFELMDLIGLDVNLATSQSIFERTASERFEPVAVQRTLVAQGRLGRKASAGFYDYADGPPQHDDDSPTLPSLPNADENVVILGFAGLAAEMHELLQPSYSHVRMWENEDDLDELGDHTTVVFDVGDGVSDRARLLERLDGILPAQAVIFVDAYATDLDGLAGRLQHPERVVGYGILASLAGQRVVEVVDAEATSDDALEFAQDFFESIGRRVVLVADHPGLFLGRTVASIVDEAIRVVEERIASSDDVDLAMQLGTGYPKGPLAWGREIGGDRVARILQRLAASDGAAFAPHRALWVLDVQEHDDALLVAQAEQAIE